MNTALTELQELFVFARERTVNRPALQHLYSELVRYHKQLNEPMMRIAVVGKIKAGKSTLMNALLEEVVVATGIVETTFNVSWLRFGPERFIQIHFKDGRPPEQKPVDALIALTRYNDADRAYLLNIDHIEVFLPNPLLHTFDLIDTPGLESFYEDDTKSTREFLGVHGQALTERTQTEVSKADAVLYLFSQGIADADESLLKEFLGEGISSVRPFNAIGLLTKVDAYSVADPLAGGAKIAQRLAQQPKIQNLFYTVHAVSGLLALGAKTLTQEEFDTLVRLSHLSPEYFDYLSQAVKRFKEKDSPDIPASPAQRQKLLERLGPFGIRRAYYLLREGVSERRSLANRLFEESGLLQLRHLILSHFGNRAVHIKLYTNLQRIEQLLFHTRQQMKGEDRKIIEEITVRFGRLKRRQHVFQEMQVLGDYYEGKLNFDQKEVNQLLAVTGENGRSYGALLGLDEHTSSEEMIAVATQRIGYWRARANDFACEHATTHAATILTRSYEAILHSLKASRNYER